MFSMSSQTTYPFMASVSLSLTIEGIAGLSDVVRRAASTEPNWALRLLLETTTKSLGSFNPSSARMTCPRRYVGLILRQPSAVDDGERRSCARQDSVPGQWRHNHLPRSVRARNAHRLPTRHALRRPHC